MATRHISLAARLEPDEVLRRSQGASRVDVADQCDDELLRRLATQIGAFLRDGALGALIRRARTTDRRLLPALEADLSAAIHAALDLD